MKLSRFQLKWIALFCMICDHVGCVFFPENSVGWFILRLFVGRIAFPLFTVLFVQGFFYTKHYVRHMVDLCLWGMISEPFFDKMLFDTWIDWSHQNVMFTWALSFFLLWLLERMFTWFYEHVIDKVELYVLSVCTVLIVCVFAEWLHVDYGAVGILCVVLVYLLMKYKRRAQLWLEGGIVGVFLMICTGGVGAGLTVVPLLFYDNTKNCKRGLFWKYVFYIAYPLHLAIFCGLRNL